METASSKRKVLMNDPWASNTACRNDKYGVYQYSSSNELVKKITAII